jgi:hypothetical protein
VLEFRHCASVLVGVLIIIFLTSLRNAYYFQRSEGQKCLANLGILSDLRRLKMEKKVN